MHPRVRIKQPAGNPLTGQTTASILLNDTEFFAIGQV